MTGIKQILEAGDAIIVAVAGFLKKQGWSYFMANWKTFLDGLLGSQDIPAEWRDLDDSEKQIAADHWTRTMAEHGIESEHAAFLIGKIMGMLKDGWDIYAHFHPGAADSTNA